MKIYGSGKVWSVVQQKCVAQFENGVIETNDKEIIDLCKLNGFEMEGEVEEPKVVRTRKKAE